jgi:hypothetical protein
MKKSAKNNLKQSKSGAKRKIAPDEKLLSISAEIKLSPSLERIRQRTEISRKAALSRAIIQTP